MRWTEHETYMRSLRKRGTVQRYRREIERIRREVGIERDVGRGYDSYARMVHRRCLIVVSVSFGILALGIVYAYA